MLKLATKIDGPLAVIGDVHGQVDKLQSALERLRMLPDYERRWIVFVGDFVDRGPDPRSALDVVTDLLVEHPRTTAIAGNHDLAMAAALGWVPTPEYSNRWLDHYDAQSTFESYGVDFGDLPGLADRVPAVHREFLAGLPWCVEHPRFLFVHAGLDGNTPLEVQMRILRQRDFTLNRPQWLCSKSIVDSDGPPDCRATIVSGHVYVPEVQIRPRRILVDTTGGAMGDLSCLLLPEKKVVVSGGDAMAVGEDKSWWKLW